MNNLKLIILLILPFTVSGCVSDYLIRKFMDGPQACQPDEMNKVVDNRRALRNVSNRLTREYVLRAFGNKPDMTQHLRMPNGEIYVADSYQVTTGKLCGGKTEYGTYERIFYAGGVVVGKGEPFFQKQMNMYKLSYLK